MVRLPVLLRATSKTPTRHSVAAFGPESELAGQKIGKVHIAEPRHFLGYVVDSKVLDPYIVVPCKFVLEQWYQNLVPQTFVVSISTHFSRLFKNKYISLSARDNDTLDHVLG